MKIELTPTESKIFLLIQNGLRNKEMAKKLSVTEHAIKFHITNLNKKLKTKSRKEIREIKFEKPAKFMG